MSLTWRPAFQMAGIQMKVIARNGKCRKQRQCATSSMSQGESCLLQYEGLAQSKLVGSKGQTAAK